MMQPLRVIIADDHELAREGLRAMIAREPDLLLIGESETAEGAVAMSISLRPDVVLLDVQFGPGRQDGFSAARQIRSEAPAISVLIVTLHDAPQFLSAAVHAGAQGYILKDASRADFIAAMKSVAAGGSAFPTRLLARALEAEPITRTPTPSRLSRLTQREREVLDLVKQGMTNKTIARELGLSPGTVKVHVERMLAKLGVTDRTQAAVLAASADD